MLNTPRRFPLKVEGAHTVAHFTDVELWDWSVAQAVIMLDATYSGDIGGWFLANQLFHAACTELALRGRMRREEARQ